MRIRLGVLIALLLTTAVAATEFPIIYLSGVGYRDHGQHYVDLMWSGATTPQVELWQSGVLLGIIDNDEFETVAVGKIKYTQFWVCETPYTDVINEDFTTTTYMICGVTAVTFR